MKQFIPKILKINYQLIKRNISDRSNGHSKYFAKNDRRSLHYNGMVETTQPLIDNTYVENNFNNIKLATQEISKLQLLSGEIFSFWKVVGAPKRGRGYKLGRSIVNGEVKEEIGGGLCQLAGLMYHTAIKAGLEILERHAHSLDIHEGEERYTPLGVDAAVVYGYKDLRIKNSRGFPIKFTFILKKNEIACRVFLEDNISSFSTKFICEKKNNIEKVKTFLVDEYGNEEEYSENEYLKM